MKKYSIIDLKGGLGNQLFCISFAHYLISNGHKVFIDTSFYNQKNEFKRQLNLDINDFGFKEINVQSDLIFKILGSRYEEISNLNQIKNFPISRFKGYYQDAQFLDKNYLSKSLSLSGKVKKNSLLIHLRRGDYINLQENLMYSYYDKCFEQLKDYLKDYEISVFTDDYKFTGKEFKNININKIYNKRDEDPLSIFKIMTTYENYIISNSTFSFLAAFLGYSNNSKVFYPVPWMRNSGVKIKNIPTEWHMIPNKFN